jgi:hypothetical protein
LIINIFLFLRHLTSTFLNTVYSHDPEAASLNYNPTTLTFTNPLSVFYLDNPSKELVEQIVQGASRLNTQQVPDFVPLATTILLAYADSQDHNKDAAAVC